MAGAAGFGGVVEGGEAGEGAWWMDLGFCDDLSVDFFDFSPGGYPGGPLGLGSMDSHC